jgi:ATP-dependent DNA helicase 2 subunit 1
MCVKLNILSSPGHYLILYLNLFYRRTCFCLIFLLNVLALKKSSNEGETDWETKKKSDDNFEESIVDYSTGAQHVFILIDCHPSMFLPLCRYNDTDDHDVVISPFDAALIAVHQLLKLKVKHVATNKSGKRDGVGVLLFGTKSISTTAPSAFSLSNTCYKWIDLEPPGITQVLNVQMSLPPLKKYPLSDDQYPPNNTSANLHKRGRDLQQEFASTTAEYITKKNETKLSPLRAALVRANDTFCTAKCVDRKNSSNHSNVIWIFTNQDDPCYGNEEEKRQVAQIAKDVMQNEISIKLWDLPVAGKGSTFDRTLFYDKIIHTKDDEDDDYYGCFEGGEIPNGDGFTTTCGRSALFDVHRFLDQITQQLKRHYPKRGISLFLPSSTVSIASIDLYRLVQVQRKPSYEIVCNTNNKIVFTETTSIVDSGRAEIISNKKQKHYQDDTVRIKTYVQFGESRVPFTKDEVEAVKSSFNKSLLPPYLLILGFKPSAALSQRCWYKHQMERSYFAYPNDANAPGSRRAFAALLTAMCRNRVIGIGQLCTTTIQMGKKYSSGPRLVIIIPQPEKRTTDKVQLEPPGFVLFPLPYEDDFRASVLPSSSNSPACPELVETMKHLIVAQRDFLSKSSEDDYDDPYFENPSLAFFWNYIEAVALAQPKAVFFDKMEMCENIMYDDVRARELVNKINSLLPPEQERKKKKATNTKINSDSDGALDFELMAKDGTLDRCTNDVLKRFLKSIGFSQTGKKQVLIERITAYFMMDERAD